MDVCLPQPQKAAKARRKVSRMVQSHIVWAVTTIEQYFSEFVSDRNGSWPVLVLELKHYSPSKSCKSSSHETEVSKNIFVGEKSAKGSGRFAKGWRKASLPGSHPGPKWSSLSCHVAASKTLQSCFTLCFRCGAIWKTTLSNASTSALEIYVMFPIRSPCKPLVRQIHTKTWYHFPIPILLGRERARKVRESAAKGQFRGTIMLNKLYNDNFIIYSHPGP